jgi:hypothetical protein
MKSKPACCPLRIWYIRFLPLYFMLSYIKAFNALLPQRATYGSRDIKLGLTISIKNDVFRAGSFSARYNKCGIFSTIALKNASISEYEFLIPFTIMCEKYFRFYANVENACFPVSPHVLLIIFMMASRTFSHS